MSGAFATELKDFHLDPQLAFVVESPAGGGVSASIAQALAGRWPDLQVRAATSNDDLDGALQTSDPDLLVFCSHSDASAVLADVARLANKLPRRVPILLVDVRGVVVRIGGCEATSSPQTALPGLTVESAVRCQQQAARTRRRRFQLDRLRRQNRTLRRLSLEDPLTRVLNRRGFYRFLKSEWSRASRYDSEVACVVVDIDRFKRLNDTYGHAIGDRVLRGIAGVLAGSCRTSDVLGRVGGEEFCILLPNCSERQGVVWAEKARRRVANTPIFVEGKSIQATASFGVAAAHPGMVDEHDLIDMADQAVLVAKHGGRDRVVAASSIENRRAGLGRIARSNRVVRILMDSLALRDPNVFRHSQRVSQWSTLLAKQVGLCENEIWVAEIGGLLHDVGKIGLPDDVLQKADRLSPSEREIVDSSLRGSYDIVRSAFGEGPLAETVRAHRVWVQDAGSPYGGRLPVSARIVAIADAYDSMTTQTAYRMSATRTAAVAELNRCAGVQFDGDLVREFQSLVEADVD